MIKAKCMQCGKVNQVFFDGDRPYIWCKCGKKEANWGLITNE